MMGILPAFAYESTPTLENILKWLICLIFSFALMFQTAALKAAYQTRLSLSRHLAPDNLCLHVTSALSPGAQADGRLI